jgi:hypothetical protein
MKPTTMMKASPATTNATISAAACSANEEELGPDDDEDQMGSAQLWSGKV